MQDPLVTVLHLCSYKVFDQEPFCNKHKWTAVIFTNFNLHIFIQRWGWQYNNWWNKSKLMRSLQSKHPSGFWTTPVHPHDSCFDVLSRFTPSNYKKMIPHPPDDASGCCFRSKPESVTGVLFSDSDQSVRGQPNKQKKWHHILSSIFQLHRRLPRSAPHLTSPYFTLKWSSLETSPWKLGKRVCACVCVCEQPWSKDFSLAFFFSLIQSSKPGAEEIWSITTESDERQMKEATLLLNVMFYLWHQPC